MLIDWNSTADMLIRIIAATIMGGLVGWEREKAQHNAGLRTHILICLGSVLIMCTGEYVFLTYSGLGNIDPARLGAQVVSGVGVLCAGTIMKAGSTIKGLTTATSLWCTACIGLAVGSGNIVPAAGTTIIVLIVLRALQYLEKKNKKKQSAVGIKIVLERSEQISHIMTWLETHEYMIKSFRFEYDADGNAIVYCKLHTMSQSKCVELTAGLSQHIGVLTAEMITAETAA